MRSLQNKDFVEAPDSDYPYGRIRDKAPALRGTPVNENTYGDFHQFFEKMMDVAGVTANELPENAYSGFQMIEALQKFMGKELGKLIFSTIARNYQDNTVMVLYGCNITANLPGTSTVTAGAIYYNGVFYKVEADSNIVASGGQTLVWDFDESDQPVKMKLYAGASGSGIADYDDTKLYQKIVNNTSFFGTPTFSAPITSVTVDNLLFLRNGNKVTVSGELTVDNSSGQDDISFSIPIASSENYPDSDLISYYDATNNISGLCVGQPNTNAQGLSGSVGVSVATNSMNFKCALASGGSIVSWKVRFNCSYLTNLPYSTY